MKLLYLSNYLTHYQMSIANEFYKLTNGDYFFIETGEIPEMRLKLGFKELNAPYKLKYNTNSKEAIDRMIMEADVVICGEAPSMLVKKRVNQGLLTFRDDERRYKSIKKYLKYPFYTYDSLVFNKGYLLCASAFCARDYRLSGMNPEKCFKWGYFPEFVDYGNSNSIMEKKDVQVSLLWAGRLIKWKHPELAINLAKMLSNQGIDYKLKIIGNGPLESKLKKEVKKNKLEGRVELLGPMSPDKVRKCMEMANIYLFTSDQNEGWGAVLNEAMNSACAVVASHAAGATPFLIQDGVNGFVFKSEDLISLYGKVIRLINDPVLRKTIGICAYKSIREHWSPNHAANNFIKLSKCLLEGRMPNITTGPCSKAEIMNHTWRNSK